MNAFYGKVAIKLTDLVSAASNRSGLVYLRLLFTEDSFVLLISSFFFVLFFLPDYDGRF